MEENKVHCVNSAEALQKLESKSIDLTFTSPPYNMRTRIRNGEYTTREKSEHFSKKYKYFDDDLPIQEFYSFHKGILIELLRVSKIVAYNFQIVTGSKEAFFKLIGDFYRDIKDIIIWDKGYGQPAMHEKVMNSCYEIILILEGDRKAGRVIQNSNFKRGTLDNILRIKRGKRITTKEHGAIFPEKLARKIIKSFSKEGDLVLDPFMGSGTTAFASKSLKRRFIGFEINKEYCEMTNKRLQQEVLAI